MTRIEVRRDEPIDKALRKFKSKLRKEGLLEEMKRREFYEKPSQKKRRVLAQAIKREKRRQREADFQ
ncbi:MAG: 30S ribosomal protein S21 [Candidatus Margulisiibacteriota bacterium]